VLVDLKLQGKTVMIVGEGIEVEGRTRQFLDAGARVVVAGRFTKKLKQLDESGSITLLSAKITEKDRDLIGAQNPFLVVIASNNVDFAQSVAEIAHSCGAMVYAVDLPSLNDLNMPAVTEIGEIKVAISTGGLSPATARILRKRIERMIKPEDALQVRLQGDTRSLIKKLIRDSESRKNLIYKIIRNKKIKELLKEARFEDAKKLAIKNILSSAKQNGGVDVH
jgi:precorrin-2 dehydrogenase/sirohydrochlorin ferrochelatase